MTDYAGNSKKSKEVEPREEKNLEKVVKGEVIVQKKSLGRKFKDMIIAADFKSVGHYIIDEILLPSIKNLIVDSATKGIERTIYGDRALRRRGTDTGPRYAYNNPIARTPRDMEPRRYGQSAPAISRRASQDFILSSRSEADTVLEKMNDVIDQFDAVSVADLNDLIGVQGTHVDNNWGWTFLGDVAVRQIREGYLIDLPQPEALR